MIQRIENKLACCVKCVMIVVALMAVQTVQAGTPADKTALTAAIGEAETYLGTIQESNANEAKVLAIVIDGCKAVLNNADATQTDVDFATETTNGSVNECKMAVTRNALAAAIAKGEEYLDSIRENYPEPAQKMSALIGNCKYFLNNTDSSLEVLEFGILGMEEDTKVIKTEVARIDLAAAIAKGEAYLATIQEKYPEPAQKMSALIGNCKYFLNNTDSSLDVLEFGILGMEEDTKVIKTEVARIDLAAAIAKGETYLATIQEKYPEQAQKMSALIGNCKYFLNNTDSSLDVLEFGILGMEEDTKAIKTEVARVDLAAAIAGAEEYLRSIQEGNASVVSVLQTVIATANEMKADESLTLYDLEFATAVVNEVVALSKEAGIPTGVSAARVASRMAAAYYDLSGRRMAQPAKKGVYINNGVKTVVK
jgi:hypothetical protein